MSRCYPFPPPGFIRNEIWDESLIESIKGANEEVKKDRKHKRKEKKRKERGNEVDRSKKRRHKRLRKDGIANASKKVVDDDDHHRGLIINSEVEFLEKSCLTMEFELHQSTSQNSCDSTLHSNENPLGGRHNNDSETGIGLKNPVVKDRKQSSSRENLDASQAAPRESVVHSTIADQVPRDALRICQEKIRDPNFGSSRRTTTKLSKEKKTIPLKDNREVSKEKMISSSLCTHPEQEKPSSSHQETIGPSKLLCSKCPPSVAARFLNLIENWVPDRVESKLTDSEDQEEWWLFMKFGAKRHDQDSNQRAIQESSSMLWPTARFLPEAELHALPFTVPF